MKYLTHDRTVTIASRELNVLSSAQPLRRSDRQPVSVWHHLSILIRTNTRQHLLCLDSGRIRPFPSLNMPHPSLPVLTVRVHKPLISFIGKRIWPSCAHIVLSMSSSYLHSEQHSHRHTPILQRHPSIARRSPAIFSTCRVLPRRLNIHLSENFGMHQRASRDQSTTNWKNGKSMSFRYAKHLLSFRKIF